MPFGIPESRSLSPRIPNCPVPGHILAKIVELLPRIGLQSARLTARFDCKCLKTGRRGWTRTSDPLLRRRISVQLESRLFSIPSVSNGYGGLVEACGLLLNSGASTSYVFIYIRNLASQPFLFGTLSLALPSSFNKSSIARLCTEPVPISGAPLRGLFLHRFSCSPYRHRRV